MNVTEAYFLGLFEGTERTGHFCPNCGKVLPESSSPVKFCCFCGQSLKQSSKETKPDYEFIIKEGDGLMVRSNKTNRLYTLTEGKTFPDKNGERFTSDIIFIMDTGLEDIDFEDDDDCEPMDFVNWLCGAQFVNDSDTKESIIEMIKEYEIKKYLK